MIVLAHLCCDQRLADLAGGNYVSASTVRQRVLEDLEPLAARTPRLDRALDGGNAAEVIGRDAAKAAGLASALGGGATAGTIGTAPAGDIVILAVPYASAVPVVSQYGDALVGKVIVDITNPFSPGFTGLATPDGSSAAQEIAKAAPAGAHVVKAFNTVFGHVLAGGGPLDVLIAGDDAGAKASVSAFIESLGLRPLDTGPLGMARRLEETGLLMMGLGAMA